MSKIWCRDGITVHKYFEILLINISNVRLHVWIRWFRSTVMQKIRCLHCSKVCMKMVKRMKWRLQLSCQTMPWYTLFTLTSIIFAHPPICSRLFVDFLYSFRNTVSTILLGFRWRDWVGRYINGVAHKHCKGLVICILSISCIAPMFVSLVWLPCVHAVKWNISTK